ncbi:UNVERIFIED_CONTAM: NitT/TauT family transport system substrate-binding protein [Acetivibrio alkalicellulosi]
MKKRLFVKLIIINLMFFIISINLVGCSQRNENNIQSVRIAHFPNITHSQALVGREKGLFESAFGEKVNVEWKAFNAGPAQIEAFFANELDIGYIGPVPAINGFVRSRGDIRIISGATNAGAILISRKDIIINDLQSLKGKKIAVPQFGNTQDILLRSLLNENGLQDTAKGGDVNIIQAPNPDILTLFKNGSIDAAFVPEPWGSIIIKETEANIIFDFNEVWNDGQYSTALVIVRTKFLKDHTEIVEKFINTHVEITNYINNNPDESKEIINEQLLKLTGRSLEKEILDDSFRRLIVTNNPEEESLFKFVDELVKLGFYRTTPDTEELLDITILNKVLKNK